MHLESPQTKRALPKYLTLEQSIKLLESVDGKTKERDYCILTLFLNCGLRLSELVSVNISDIKDDNALRVVGKGNKERTIYLNNACVSAIEQYMRVRPVDGVIDRDALFISNRKRRISRKTELRIKIASFIILCLAGIGVGIWYFANSTVYGSDKTKAFSSLAVSAGVSTYGVEFLFGVKVQEGWLPTVEETPKIKADGRMLTAKVLGLIPQNEVYTRPVKSILGKKEKRVKIILFTL